MLIIMPIVTIMTMVIINQSLRPEPRKLSRSLLAAFAVRAANGCHDSDYQLSYVLFKTPSTLLLALANNRKHTNNYEQL